jgi:L-threonylcarbamoyladenylate synthase
VSTLKLKAEGIGGEASVARAAEILRNGGTVAFPTETVYGLGANALDAAAVAKIFAAKQRPGWDPLIVHVTDRTMLDRVARTNGAQAKMAEDLMKAFWPGPLTLLLPRTAEVPDAVTAGRELVGVRMPAHPVARELIQLSGVPIAAPSANRFGHTSPTTAAHVLADLDGLVDAVLDGGPTRVGVESTVLDLGAMRIYRPGAITAADIARVVGREPELVTISGASQGAVSDEARISPGLELRHYAPRARLILVDGQEQLLAEVARSGVSEVGVMLPDDWRAGGATAVFRWGPWGNPDVLARLLFFGLRLLDDRGVTVIVCPMPEAAGIGEAIRDRLL